MAEKLGDEEVVSLEDVVVSHVYEIMALITILVKTGILIKDINKRLSVVVYSHKLTTMSHNSIRVSYILISRMVYA